MTSKKHMLVGTDVELFGYDSLTSDFAPFTDKLDADKKHPRKIDDWKNLSVQEDGVALEITLDPSSPKTFFNDVYQAKNLVRNWIRTNLRMDFYNQSEMNLEGYTLPKKANQLGCDPDFDAYVQPVQERTKLRIEDFNHYRFASGHLHFGVAGFGIADEIPNFIKAQFADFFLGAPMRLGSCSRDRDRVPFYGLPGLYRPKSYGFEYRTPSNQWLFRSNSDAMARALLEFESLFKMKLAEVKLFYRAINWDLVRKVIMEGYNDANNQEWRDHCTELGRLAYTA